MLLLLRTHARTYARTHARTKARTHTHTHTREHARTQYSHARTSNSLASQTVSSQDHQEPHYPVYYSSGKPLNPVAGNAAPDSEAAANSEEPEAAKNPWEPGATNVMGAGGVSYQYPGRGGTR